jgi:lipoyl-dependent peroxiredoxin
MKRFGSTAWSGSLPEGKGSVSTESHAMNSYPYTFFSRSGEKPDTNPEELLGAAHAACFANVVCSNARNRASRAGTIGQQVRSRHRQGWRRFAITSVRLSVAAKIPGIDEARIP